MKFLITPLNAGENVQCLNFHFRRTQDHRIAVNPDRCELGKKCLIFRGQAINQYSTKIRKNTSSAILDFAVQFSVKNLK